MKKVKTSLGAVADYFLILAVFLVVFAGTLEKDARAADTPSAQADQIRPGDKVCLYDIGPGDPLIDNKSNDSLKYWYRSSLGRQKSRYELRPMARHLLLKILWPGLTINGVDERGKHWYKATAAVIKGGGKPGENARAIQRGANALLRDEGRSIVVDWQVLYFEKARFKKKGLFGCKRKYEKY